MSPPGRLIGYTEEHMNAWDCLAAMLIIKEAGGIVEPFNRGDVIANGTIALAGGKGVFARIARFPPSPTGCSRGTPSLKLAGHQDRTAFRKADTDVLTRNVSRVHIRRHGKNIAERRSNDELQVTTDIGDLLQLAGQCAGRAGVPDVDAAWPRRQLRGTWHSPSCGQVKHHRAEMDRGPITFNRGHLAIEDIGLADEIGDECIGRLLVKVARRAILRERALFITMMRSETARASS